MIGMYGKGDFTIQIPWKGILQKEFFGKEILWQKYNEKGILI